eukprot:TRINITY_DN1495_c0_g2_i1.p1 TRINITY_DN1495_c0_g2~~TRINITY_DN1495_c0_g2_i1.p1  ORF type:complete len:936 (-),score=282.25 TRINITY_DN1495_c0_g2_i1:58-2499(-)
MLMTVNESGLQHLLSGARGNVGVKAGRYMFEVKIVELVNQTDVAAMHVRSAMPKQLLRIGFSTAGSVPILGDTEESVCFDSEGAFLFNKQRIPIASRYGTDCTLAVVLNLDPDSKNHNTISLFKDGERISPPHELPEALRGKALFPTVTFKNTAIHVNFGATQHAPLPFKCRMIQEAAAEDAEVVTYQSPPDGKYEVVFPVCMPDEGTFEWLDWFLEKNPHFCEISDRKILEWAVRSGLARPRASTFKNSNDKPDMAFGIPSLDDGTVKTILQTALSVSNRDLVVMEVQGNLLKEERQKLLKRFRLPHLKRVAKVLVGQPSDEFWQATLDKLLQEKQEKSDRDFNFKAEEKVRMRLLEMQRKQMEWAKQKAAKKAEEEAARAEAEANGEAAEEKKADGEEETAPMEEEPAEETPPKVELTEEERENWSKKPPGSTPDLTQLALSTAFSKFTLPEKSEGFDEVEFAWQPRAKAEQYMQSWIKERKVTIRIDDLQPSDWFRERWQKWQKDLQGWHAKHMEWKDPAKRAALSASKPAEKDKEGEGKDEKKEDAKAEDGNGEEKKIEIDPEDDPNFDYLAELEQELDNNDSDVFDIEDVCNIGHGEPIFASFAFEDWALLSLRFELHLLAHAFKHDCGDPERAGIYPDHLLFYYNKYFKKGLNPRNYGVADIPSMIELIKDTVLLCGPSVVESQLSAELESNDIFVKLTEESRRDRQRRVDAGDESAVLQFLNRPATAQLDTNPLKAAGSKAAPTQPGALGGKGNSKSMHNAVLAQQQRQQQARQQLSQGWYGGNGSDYNSVPLAQQMMMAMSQSWS